MAVVKATLMRITLHTVHTGDYQAVREAMEPTLRAVAHRSSRFTNTGLNVAAADALVADLLEYADRPRTESLPPLRLLVAHAAQCRGSAAPR